MGNEIIKSSLSVSLESECTASQSSLSVPLESECTASQSSLSVPLESECTASQSSLSVPLESECTASQSSLSVPLESECTASQSSLSVPLESECTASQSSLSVSLESGKNIHDSDTTFIPFDYGNQLDKTKRNLPHWEQTAVTYFITFRLADAIPITTTKKIRQERETWLNQHLEPYSDDDKIEYYRLFSERIQSLLDAGSGSCILVNRGVSDMVKDALLYFNENRYKLGHWVIMPNHVHIIVTPLSGFNIGKITHSWKSFTAHEINKEYNRNGILWQHESYDHIVRNKKQLNAIEKYIIGNPAKAKIKTGFQSSLSVSLE